MKPGTSEISSEATTCGPCQAPDGAVTSLTPRRDLMQGSRRPLFAPDDSPSSRVSRASLITVRSLGHVPAVRRRRRAARLGTFPFALPRRQQLLLLNLPELRDELRRRERQFLTRLAMDLRGAGIGHNAVARLLGVSASRLCVWLQEYRPSHRGEHLRRPAACSISVYFRL